jgi:hypothetical protein
MNRNKFLTAVFAFSLLILALPAVASAQWRNDRDDDYYGNNRSNRNLQATIKNLKNRAKRFERIVDRALDNSRYDDRNREDRINELAQDFRNAAEDLDDNYDNRRDYNRSSDEVRRVLQLGSQLDRALSRARFEYRVQNEWNQIRQDLRILADAYNYNYNNRRNNRRNNRNNDYDWQNFVPFQLPF